MRAVVVAILVTVAAMAGTQVAVVVGTDAPPLPDGDVAVLGTESAFEETVLADTKVWLVAFIVHGADRSEGLVSALPAIDAAVPARIATLDVAGAKPIGYEFGVRRRTAPQLKLFVSRSRNAHDIEIPEQILDDLEAARSGAAGEDAASITIATSAKLAGLVKEAVAAHTADNAMGDDGVLDKVTLALGGADGDDAEL